MIITKLDCNLETHTRDEEYTVFRPNGNEYRRKRQLKALRYLQRGKAPVTRASTRRDYARVEFSPDTFVDILFRDYSSIMRGIDPTDSFVLVGSKDFATMMHRSMVDMHRMGDFSFCADVGYMKPEERFHRSVGLPVIVSPRVSGIVVLDRRIFRGLFR